MSILKLIWVFLKIGAVSFGGGWTIVGIIRNEVIGALWLDEAGFSELVAIAQVTPGPIALNAATLVGFKLQGMRGAILATLSVVLVPVICIAAATIALSRFSKGAARLNSALKTAAIAMTGMTLWGFAASPDMGLRSAIFALVSFVIVGFTKLSPIIVILGAGALNLALSFIL
jgi:chromate transporter